MFYRSEDKEISVDVAVEGVGVAVEGVAVAKEGVWVRL